jgi:hypothetical protein
MSLQICFMNESPTDQIEHQETDDRLSSTGHGYDESTGHGTLYNRMDNSRPRSVTLKIDSSPNNNSYNSGLALSSKLLYPQSIENSVENSPRIFFKQQDRPSFLFTKFRGLNRNTQRKALSAIPKPLEREEFHGYHSRLHAEARLALSQAKDMAKMQMEIERQQKKPSPIADLINLPFPYRAGRSRLSRFFLSSLSVAQLQILVNDLHTQIEGLNEELVGLLLQRDELHMEQDSILVDIEDLTIFLCSKE